MFKLIRYGVGLWVASEIISSYVEQLKRRVYWYGWGDGWDGATEEFEEGESA